MTVDRVTQCPHCKATFKVSDSQLSVANGKVRCGACMNIFDALAYSLGGVNTDPTDNQTPEHTPSSDDPAVELEDSLLEEKSSESDLIQDNPDEDDTGNYHGRGLDDELSTSFLELDKQAGGNDPYKTGFHTPEEELVESTDSADDSWAEKMLAEEETSRQEPFLSADEPDDEYTNHEAEQTSYQEEPSEYLDKKEQEDYETLTFQYEQDEAPKKRHWLITLLLVVFNIALVLALVAQASWFHYEKLAKYPQAVKIFELACEHLGCELPELEDITLVKSNNLVVRSHPLRPKALIIDTVITNEADFAQDFPDIALYFSDINGNTIAQKLITRDDYLSEEFTSWKKMPAQQSIHISLEMIDPGKEAVNYALKFFPAKAEQK